MSADPHLPLCLRGGLFVRFLTMHATPMASGNSAVQFPVFLEVHSDYRGSCHSMLSLLFFLWLLGTQTHQTISSTLNRNSNCEMIVKSHLFMKNNKEKCDIAFTQIP